MTNRIAVIQTAFPGDVILCTPVFEGLKSQYPDWETAAVVRPESVSLIEGNPFIDRIIPFDKYGADRGVRGILRMAGKLKGFDRAVIIQRHLRSALIAYLAGIPERIGFSNSSAARLYTSRMDYAKGKHEVRRCLDLIGIDDRERRFKPRIFIDDLTENRAMGIIEESGIGSEFAVAAPGSVWPTKRYPYYPGLIHLIEKEFNLPVVLLGGSGDIELSRSIAESCKTKPLDLTGRTTLLESAAIISRARIVLANDSAPSHIASAMGVPVAAIFGPTIPEFGFAPYSDNSVTVDIGELECRPCSTHGSVRCPRKHFRCMLELEPGEIIGRIRSLI